MGLLDDLKGHGITKKPVGIRVSKDEDGLPIIVSHETRQIKTQEALLKEAGINPLEWEVERFTANVWHQMSTANGLVPLWQTKAQLRKIDLNQENIREIVEKGWKSFKKGLEKVSLPNLPKKKTGTMVEFALPDLHLGKMSWTEETGSGNWDLKIAQKTYNDALDDLISRAPEAEEGWIVVGNDFYNVDSDQKMTTSGTVQDEDGRWQKTFVAGKELIMGAIGRLRAKYPKVKVIVVYGNHDRQRSFYLGELLSEAFKSVKGIEVDNRPLNRKYYFWGDTGIGYTHGDRIKAKDLSHLCQNEARQIWGLTKRFEMHLGHLHQDLVKNLGGVIVRWLPALCPPDSWHAQMGYTMSEKAAMALVYDQRGMQSILMHYPDPKLFV